MMTTDITNAEKISKLPWSMGANSANTVFIQLTYFGSVFVLFLNALGLDKTQIGFLLSLIPFSDMIALFVAGLVARIGYKRTYVTSYGARTTITAGLLFTPWIASTFGAQATLLFITGIVGLFALCRSFAMTAYYPWIQEYVPDSVRGKYSATNNIFMTLTGLATITGAGFLLERSTGLTGFMILIGIGVAFGYISTWGASHIPGGAPAQAEAQTKSPWQALREAIRDKDLMRYLFGAGSLTLAIVALTSFVPLFMQEQVGISSGNVVFIQTGTLLGGLLSTYLWGWTADRYGSRPIMLSGATLRTLLPVLWILIPRQNLLSLYFAIGIAMLQGIADMGWVIGSTRLLYVSIVPVEKKRNYMALYAAWVGLVGGAGQLLGGQIVQYSSGLSGRFLIFTLDPYTGLFVLGFVLPIVAIFLLRGVRADTRVTVEQFAGLFLRGNPLMAITLLIEYHLAKDERAMVQITERLGQTKSPLTVDELLEALKDPRFNVRFEAIISIARTRSDPRLTEALIKILTGTELALSVVAAWALGRIGDQTALEALRQGLDSDYQSIRAHCARALGTLGDRAIAPLLLERLQHAPDKGLQMAYASTLGKLKFDEATGALLDLLHITENEGARMELALSLARIIGAESHFIRLLRDARQDTGTVTSQAVSALKKKIPKELENGDDLTASIHDCANALARNNLDEGALLLEQLLVQLPSARFGESCVLILEECAKRLGEFKATRLEYLLLALHTANVGWQT